MSEIKIGDIVRLKSGSPKMTVKEVESEVYITCFYWNKIIGDFKSIKLEADQLVKVEPTK